MIRVIAGSLKGRRLKTPTWEGLRPTSDRLRETLFNVLRPRIAGARVVDGFAGTGAVGIEALSRGAAHVTFIEQHRRAAALIGENLAACGISSGYTIVERDAVTALDEMPYHVAFDLILLDPPYDIVNIGEVLVAAARRLHGEGLLVLERATRREPDIPTSLARLRDVGAGDSTLTILARAELQRGSAPRNASAAEN